MRNNLLMASVTRDCGSEDPDAGPEKNRERSRKVQKQW